MFGGSGEHLVWVMDGDLSTGMNTIFITHLCKGAPQIVIRFYKQFKKKKTGFTLVACLLKYPVFTSFDILFFLVTG